MPSEFAHNEFLDNSDFRNERKREPRLSGKHLGMKHHPYLREWRLWAGLDQAAMAAELDTSTSVISAVENDKQRYNRDHLIGYAETIGCSVGQLFQRPPRSKRSDLPKTGFVMTIEPDLMGRMLLGIAIRGARYHRSAPDLAPLEDVNPKRALKTDLPAIWAQLGHGFAAFIQQYLSGEDSEALQETLTGVPLDESHDPQKANQK